ncbi:MAG: DUF3504 domain-containing protein, partial [Pseudomonadota bacterium]
KSQRKEKPFQSIEKPDMERIRTYFDRSTPQILQQEVWFNIMLHFGLRGRETFSQLSRDSISFDSDSDGHRYAYLCHSFLSKNVRSSLSQKEFSDNKNCRMYEDRSEQSRCPVKALESYFSKMEADTKTLFPQPKTLNATQIWYCQSKKLGLNQLGKMMKQISEQANLSKLYTNHCVRVTVVSELHNQGFSANEISNVTGECATVHSSTYIYHTSVYLMR